MNRIKIFSDADLDLQKVEYNLNEWLIKNENSIAVISIVPAKYYIVVWYKLK